MQIYPAKHVRAHLPLEYALVVSQVVLCFDLPTVGQRNPPSLSSFSPLPRLSSLTLSLSPSLQPSGLLDLTA